MPAPCSKNSPENASLNISPPAPAPAGELRHEWRSVAMGNDNAQSVLRLIVESMMEFTCWDHLPDAEKERVRNQLSDYRCAIDTVLPMMAETSAFLDHHSSRVSMVGRADENGFTQSDNERQIARSFVSEDCQAVIDNHKWAHDKLEELCPTSDKVDPRFDPAPAAKLRFRLAETEEAAALLALCEYQAFTQGERIAKAVYLLTIHESGGLDIEHVHAILNASVW